jgi:hypothetical protein
MPEKKQPPSFPDRWLAAMRRWHWIQTDSNPLCFSAPEGYKAMFSSSGEVSIWGPDGLALDPPAHPSKKELRRALHVCSYCKKEVLQIVRIGFAGRCCPPCREAHKAEVEFPGWTK